MTCMCTVNCSVCSINLNVQPGDDDQRKVNTADMCFIFSPILCPCVYEKHKINRNRLRIDRIERGETVLKRASGQYEMEKKEEMKGGNAYF